MTCLNITHTLHRSITTNAHVIGNVYTCSFALCCVKKMFWQTEFTSLLVYRCTDGCHILAIWKYNCQAAFVSFFYLNFLTNSLSECVWGCVPFCCFKMSQKYKMYCCKCIHMPRCCYYCQSHMNVDG